jgi:hypothetical protein
VIFHFFFIIIGAVWTPTPPRSRWNAPKGPLDADAQAEADGGNDEAPLDEESDDGSVAGSSPGGSSPHSSHCHEWPACHCQWQCHSGQPASGSATASGSGSVPNSVLKPSFNMLKPGFNIPQVKGNGGVCLSCPLRYRGNIECEGVL